MKTIGNTVSNQRYNPANKLPSTAGVDSYEDIDLERFIRDKYERKTLMKARKLPPLPPQAGESERSMAEAVRSPILSSNSSANLRVGGNNRISGESFERAKSPASTNSSFEAAPPPKPPRPGVGSRGSSNPFESVDWTGLERTLPNPSPSKGGPVKREVLYSPPVNGIPVVSGAGLPTTNPFEMQSVFMPIPAPAPLPPVPQAQLPPVNLSENQHRSNSMPAPQLNSQAWNPMPPAFPAVNGQLMNPHNPSPNVSAVRPPLASSNQPNSPNPFIQPQQPPISSTNPFFPIPQTQSPTTPTSPSFQPQFSQPTQSYQPQFFNPQTSFLQPSPNQPVQPLSPNQPNPNMVYGRPRLDKQSILSLYNAPPPDPTQQFIQAQNPNGVPAWNNQ